MATYLMILCGGSGERLWPLTGDGTPKQLLPFIGARTLLDLTIERLQPLRDMEVRIGIVTTARYADAIAPLVAPSIDEMIIEPEARNTAAAVMFTCQRIIARDPAAVIAFIPADHHIEDKELFREQLAKILSYVASHDVLATIGVFPTNPATGYGYMVFDPADTTHVIREVKQFYEKPSANDARVLIQQNAVVWNIGVYAGKAALFIQELSWHAPTLATAVIAYLRGGQSYNDIPALSFDRAVAEKTKQLVVLPSTMRWSDVGNILTFVDTAHLAQTVLTTTIQIRSSGNTVYAAQGMTIALVGVCDLVVVVVDNRILIVHKKDVEQVRDIVPLLHDVENNHMTQSSREAHGT